MEFGLPSRCSPMKTKNMEGCIVFETQW